MNFKHPLFNPANWTEDQRVSAFVIGMLLGLAALCITSAFLLPAGYWAVSFLLGVMGALLGVVAFTGFTVEFWEERNK